MKTHAAAEPSVSHRLPLDKIEVLLDSDSSDSNQSLWDAVGEDLERVFKKHGFSFTESSVQNYPSNYDHRDDDFYFQVEDPSYKKSKSDLPKSVIALIKDLDSTGHCDIGPNHTEIVKDFLENLSDKRSNAVVIAAAEPDHKSKIQFHTPTEGASAFNAMLRAVSRANLSLSGCILYYEHARVEFRVRESSDPELADLGCDELYASVYCLGSTVFQSPVELVKQLDGLKKVVLFLNKFVKENTDELRTNARVKALLHKIAARLSVIKSNEIKQATASETPMSAHASSEPTPLWSAFNQLKKLVGRATEIDVGGYKVGLKNGQLMIKNMSYTVYVSGVEGEDTNTLMFQAISPRIATKVMVEKREINREINTPKALLKEILKLIASRIKHYDEAYNSQQRNRYGPSPYRAGGFNGLGANALGAAEPVPFAVAAHAKAKIAITTIANDEDDPETVLSEAREFYSYVFRQHKISLERDTVGDNNEGDSTWDFDLETSKSLSQAEILDLCHDIANSSCTKNVHSAFKMAPLLVSAFRNKTKTRISITDGDVAHAAAEPVPSKRKWTGVPPQMSTTLKYSDEEDDTAADELRDKIEAAVLKHGIENVRVVLNDIQGGLEDDEESRIYNIEFYGNIDRDVLRKLTSICKSMDQHKYKIHPFKNLVTGAAEPHAPRNISFRCLFNPAGSVLDDRPRFLDMLKKTLTKLGCTVDAVKVVAGDVARYSRHPGAQVLDEQGRDDESEDLAGATDVDTVVLTNLHVPSQQAALKLATTITEAHCFYGIYPVKEFAKMLMSNKTVHAAAEPEVPHPSNTLRQVQTRLTYGPYRNEVLSNELSELIEGAARKLGINIATEVTDEETDYARSRVYVVNLYDFDDLCRANKPAGSKLVRFIESLDAKYKIHKTGNRVVAAAEPAPEAQQEPGKYIHAVDGKIRGLLQLLTKWTAAEKSAGREDLRKLLVLCKNEAWPRLSESSQKKLLDLK